MENYIFFNSKISNLRLKNQWVQEILEAPLNLEKRPDILNILAQIFSENELALSWEDYNKINFSNLSEKTLFLYQLIKKFHTVPGRLRLLTSFVNSNIPFEFKRLYFNQGLDNHLYSPSKILFQAFLGSESILSHNEQLVLIKDAISKPVLNLAFLISFKDHPLYERTNPNSDLQKYYDCIEQLEITENIGFNTFSEYFVNIKHDHYFNLINEEAPLEAFINLSMLLSFFQKDNLHQLKFDRFKEDLIDKIFHHSEPELSQYLRTVFEEMSTDLMIDPQWIIEYAHIKNHFSSQLLLQIYLQHVNHAISWLDINQFAQIILDKKLFNPQDKFLNWIFLEIEKKVFQVRKGHQLNGFRLKLNSLKLLIQYWGVKPKYLSEIFHSLNFLDNIHYYRHHPNTLDYKLLCQLLYINYQSIIYLTHSQKIMVFLTKLLTEPSLQLQNTLKTEQIHLEILNEPRILAQFKIKLIFACFSHAKVNTQTHLINYLANIRMLKGFIHNIPLNYELTKLRMASHILNTNQIVIRPLLIELLMILLNDNRLLPEFPLSDLMMLRNIFVATVQQMQEVDLSLQMAQTILKISPVEKSPLCEFLWQHLLFCPFLSLEQQSKLVLFLRNQNEKIIETQWIIDTRLTNDSHAPTLTLQR